MPRVRIKVLDILQNSDILIRVMRDKTKKEKFVDTVTINGNVYVVNNDPKHRQRQLEGYCGNNPK